VAVKRHTWISEVCCVTGVGGIRAIIQNEPSVVFLGAVGRFLVFGVGNASSPGLISEKMERD